MRGGVPVTVMLVIMVLGVAAVASLQSQVNECNEARHNFICKVYSNTILGTTEDQIQHYGCEEIE